MNRNEAVSYLKELLSQCSDMSPNAVSFEQSLNARSIDYTVRIKGSMHESDKEVVREIAKKYSFEVKDDQDSVLVYKPI